MTFKDGTGFFRYIAMLDVITNDVANVGLFPESTFDKAIVVNKRSWSTWILEKTQVDGSTVKTHLAVVKLTEPAWLNGEKCYIEFEFDNLYFTSKLAVTRGTYVTIL